MHIVIYVSLLCFTLGAAAQDLNLANDKPLSVPGSNFQDCPDCPEMVVIPTGSFDMGSIDADDEEKPVHRVTFDYSFALGKTEVTRRQWRAIMGSIADDGDGNYPVENVSWNDAHEFIRRLNLKTGQRYRLPSEAEWEYACRAGNKSEYCGSDSVDNVAWTERNSKQKVHPVAEKQANAFYLYDMSGNVWEWVEDSSHDDYKNAPTDGRVWTGNELMRMLRGGSWSDDPETARAANRYKLAPSEMLDGVGFRLMRMLP